jgi:hypothetical protein
MCRYPLVYGIIVIPKSVTRVIQLATQSTTTPASQILGFQMFYSLIGFADVVLFFKTRQGLLLFEEIPPDVESIDLDETTADSM